MSGPMGELSGNTVTDGNGPTAGSASDVARDQPCDAPGMRDSAGWVKTDAGNSDGWDRIDDVDSGDGGWMQC